MYNVYILNSPKIIPLIKSVKSLSCCASANQTNTLLKAKNKKLKSGQALALDLKILLWYQRVTEHTATEGGAIIWDFFKTLAGSSKQKFELIVFNLCLYLILV